MLCLDKLAFLGQRKLSLCQQFVQDAVQLPPVLLGHLKHNRKFFLLHRHIKISRNQIQNYFFPLIRHSSPSFFQMLYPVTKKHSYYKSVRGFILNI